MVLGKIFITSDRKKSLECITILQGWCQIFFHLSVAKQSWKKKKMTNKRSGMKMYLFREALLKGAECKQKIN
jgi:hypothetical protein